MSRERNQPTRATHQRSSKVMRSLKFRAWDTGNKTYTYVTLGDLICGACTESGDKKLSGNTQIWEESTGIKDESGREIYEGDIVKMKYPRDRRFIARFVVLKDPRSPRIMFLDETKSTELFDIFSHMRDHYEIIGNIHENPELLKKATNTSENRQE